MYFAAVVIAASCVVADDLETNKTEIPQYAVEFWGFLDGEWLIQADAASSETWEGRISYKTNGGKCGVTFQSVMWPKKNQDRRLHCIGVQGWDSSRNMIKAVAFAAWNLDRPGSLQMTTHWKGETAEQIEGERTLSGKRDQTTSALKFVRKGPDEMHMIWEKVATLKFRRAQDSEVD